MESIAYQSDIEGTFHIYVMNADGTNKRQISSGKDIDDRHPAWSPDGNAIAVDSGTPTKREIWIIDGASQRRTQVTRLGNIATFPSWSPDGTRIASRYRPTTPADAGPFCSMDVGRRSATAAARADDEGASHEENNQCRSRASGLVADGSRLAFLGGNLAASS